MSTATVRGVCACTARYRVLSLSHRPSYRGHRASRPLTTASSSSSSSDGRVRPIVKIYPNATITAINPSQQPSSIDDRPLAAHFGAVPETTTEFPLLPLQHGSLPEPPRTIYTPLARVVARFLQPYVMHLGYHHLAAGQRLYYTVKSYAMSVTGTGNDEYGLIVDERTKQSAVQSLFMFVLHYRLLESIQLAHTGSTTTNDSAGGSGSTELSDPVKVHQIVLESWWNDLANEFGASVGGLLMNKNLMEIQNRTIAMYQTFAMALAQGQSMDETKVWLRSIIARELYHIDNPTVTGVTAQQCELLTEWLLQALLVMKQCSDRQLVSGEIFFPAFPSVDRSAASESLELYQYNVEKSRLMKKPPTPAKTVRKD